MPYSNFDQFFQLWKQLSKERQLGLTGNFQGMFRTLKPTSKTPILEKKNHFGLKDIAQNPLKLENFRFWFIKYTHDKMTS